jgi:hypothetical protein
MRWFVAAVALAVNVAGCDAMGVAGDEEIDTLVGMLGADTLTVCWVVFDVPPLSVAVSLTTNEPPELNAWVTIIPVAVPSPPKSQKKVQFEHAAPSSCVLDALNVTV